jgi:hypothetical protein
LRCACSAVAAAAAACAGLLLRRLFMQALFLEQLQLLCDMLAAHQQRQAALSCDATACLVLRCSVVRERDAPARRAVPPAG